MQLFDGKQCISICLKNKNEYVRLAVGDMIKDFKRVSDAGVCPEVTSEEMCPCIVIEENAGNISDPICDESFSIKTDGEKIRILAKTYLGTMWGIYTFCEKYLGVDPCYLFNDMETQKHKSLSVSDIDISEAPDGFRFRGAFINDEDLLTGWRDGGGIRYIDYAYYAVTVDEAVINMVIETILRLRLNLIIPASLLDIDNPAEKLLADCVARRGIYLSQHHIEPLGLSTMAFKNYCKKYDKAGTFSYIKSPETMEEAWEFYADKWAQYDNVVWQLGLRGEYDRPVWEDEIPTEEELRKYGEFISNAYAKQKEIVMKVTDGRAKYFTSTLWMEGSALMEKGLLQFPENTMVIFADTGLNQMYGREYYTIKRSPDMEYGIYYHLQYFGAGPHLAPQTGLHKLYHNTELAYTNGDNSYYIMNVSNIREFVFELKAYSQMGWDVKGFSAEKYMDEYCGLFGQHAEETKKIIDGYYKNLPWLKAEHLTKTFYNKYFNFHLDDSLDNVKNFILKGENLLETGANIIGEFHKEASQKEVYKLYYEAAKSAISVYEELYCRIAELCEKLSGHLKKHMEVKWLLYTKTLICIYIWYVNLYEAKAHCDERDMGKMRESLDKACKSLEEYLEYRKCAEYGIFENWYRGEEKMNVAQKLSDTKRLLYHTIDI